MENLHDEEALPGIAFEVTLSVRRRSPALAVSRRYHNMARLLSLSLLCPVPTCDTLFLNTPETIHVHRNGNQGCMIDIILCPRLHPNILIAYRERLFNLIASYFPIL